MHDGRTVYGMGEEEFAEDTAELVKKWGYNLQRMLWDNAKIYKRLKELSREEESRQTKTLALTAGLPQSTERYSIK